MDFSKIKKLIQQNGDKFIVLEDGEPELVIMSFAEYEKLVKLNANPRTYVPKPKAGMAAEGLSTNPANEAGKEGGSEEELQSLESYPETVVVSESIGLPMRGRDIKLEDLPI